MGEKAYPLTQLENGDYAILIPVANGAKVENKVLGVITAHPKAQFVAGGKTYLAGKHVIDFLGKKYNVEVKDISPDITFYDLERVASDYKEECRIFKRKVDPIEMQEKVDRARKQNEKARAEIFGRVGVSEV